MKSVKNIDNGVFFKFSVWGCQANVLELLHNKILVYHMHVDWQPNEFTFRYAVDAENVIEKQLQEGDEKMPWYMNPVETCKVLNRIADRYQRTTLQDLKTVLDQATQLIWEKQENYYQNRR